MKVTENLKNAARKAMNDGYTRVYAITGSYRATTYCYFVSIRAILSAQTGTEFSGFRARGGRRWEGTPNTRHADWRTDIGYQRLMRSFV